MAINIRGDITYLIGANNTGFSRAIRDTREQLEELFSEASNIQRAKILSGIFGAGATAAIGAIASVDAFTNALAENYRESKILANQTGLTVQSFQALDFAAQQYGSTGERIADITKDIRDKAQEFARDGTGAFEDLRNELGLTKEEGRELAAQMVEMSGEKSIGLMIKRMEDLGLSGNQMTQVLESMGNDLSRLYPLFADGGKEANRLTESFKEVNKELSPEEAKSLSSYSESSAVLTTAIKSLGDEIATNAAPYLEKLNRLIATLIAQDVKGTDLYNEKKAGEAAKEIKRLTDQQERYSKELAKLEGLRKSGLDYFPGTYQRIDDKISALKPKLDNTTKSLESQTKALREFNIALSDDVNVGEGDEGFVGPIRPTKASQSDKGAAKASQADKEAAKKSLDALTKSVQTEQQKLDQRRKQFKEFYNKGALDDEQYLAAKKAFAKQQEDIDEDAAKKADQALKAKSGARGQLALLTEQTTKEKQEYSKRLEAFKGFLAEEYINAEEFAEAEKALNADLIEAENQATLASMSEIHAQRMQQLEAERAALEEFGGLTANLYLSISESMESVSDVMQNSLNTAIDGVSESIGNAIVNGDNLGDSLVSVAKNIAAAFVSSLVKIGIQETILAGLRATAAGTAAAGYVAEVTGQSTAAVSLASLNAFASTAAIPIVGPALAPAAAASAGALASPFAAAAIAAASSTLASSAVRGKKAVGGQISANTAAPYLVGEKGAELFVPNQAGNIIPNSQLGGGGTTNVNISAVDAAGVEQLLLENTDLILGLVREA